MVYMWYVLDLQEEEALCLCGLYGYVCLVYIWYVCVVYILYGTSVWSTCGMCLTYRRKRPCVCVVYMGMSVWSIFGMSVLSI